MESRITRVHLVPEGEPIFSEMAYSIEIDDEAAGEFIAVTDLSDRGGTVRIDFSQWESLKSAVDKMVNDAIYRELLAERGKP
jgi:hypothetical protein